jgi:hypothetical protein
MKTHLLIILCATFICLQAMEQQPVPPTTNQLSNPQALPKNLVRVDNATSCDRFKELQKKAAFYYFYNRRIGSKLHLHQQTNIPPINQETLDMLTRLALKHEATLATANYSEKFIVTIGKMPTVSETGELSTIIKKQQEYEKKALENKVSQLTLEQETISQTSPVIPTEKESFKPIIKPEYRSYLCVQFWKGEAIRQFPAFVYVDNGTEIDRTVEVSEEALEQFIAKHTKQTK